MIGEQELTFLQALGSLLAMAGAIYNCSIVFKYKWFGFVLWSIANTVLLAWSIWFGVYWISGMYIVFLLTSIYGAAMHK